MTDTPSITAIIPTYNREKTIRRAIDSILAQTMPVLEIIVVDDGSTDGTIATVQSYADSRIILIQHEENAGASAARNTGIARAGGEYIAFLDSDDIWLKDKLALQMTFMKANDYDASCTNFQITHDGHDHICKSAHRGYPARLSINEISYGCYVSPGSTLIARKESLQSVGGYSLQYKRYEDWDLLLKFIYAGYALGYLSQDLSLIYAAHSFSTKHALDSLDMIEMEHKDTILNNHKYAYRNFLSGLRFNRSATYFLEHKYAEGIKNLSSSLVIKPYKNWLFHKILWPRLVYRMETLLSRAG